MMTGFEITCANKDARGLIIRVGGAGWTLTIHEAVVKLISNQLRMNVFINGQYLDVGVRGEGFDAYLVTEPDGTPLHEIAEFQSC